MPALNLYLDNSVIGGYFDPEFEDATRRLWTPPCGSSVRPSLFMEAKIKTFDAVAESRKWKESVGRATEGMTHAQVLAYFDREAVHRRFQEALERARQQESSPKALICDPPSAIGT